MITHEEIESLIRGALPDATVETRDRTGTRDHYNIRVRSHGFTGKPLLDQHRIIYDALGGALKDGRLHAIELKTEVKELS
jgi:stress-induced morphogen